MSTPDRCRWDGWVTFVWLIAILACIAAVFLINQLGTMRVPERDVLGNISWTTGPNIPVWAAAIGQAGAGVLFAVLFSMVNSIYKNSCDQLAATSLGSAESADTNDDEEELAKAKYVDQGEELEDTAEYSAPTLMVDSVRKGSPFYGQVVAGYALMAVNGQEVESEDDISSNMVDGLNEFTFRNRNWKQIKRYVEMSPGSLGINFYY
ncbi:hypothetical protein [Halomonas organivorans]|uniref:PDZ domain-containing secreted protein n=1 Tax=Halomonas organivorans TaxID=257772 RepID=A0A7W5G6S9_9GAMM|nr:hypothetical protein [Halomonas organivorans]MBB3142187.1 PDZ domain-containing secreted protein [Halomonas organivorans]